MNSESHREHHAKAAKKLLKAVRARDASALARVRAVLHGLRDKSDDEVAEEVGLQNCQHVIAKEAGFVNWAALLKGPDHERTERCFDNIPDSLSFQLLRPGGIERAWRAERSVRDYAREHGIPTTWDEVFAEAERGERVVTPLRAAVSDADAQILAVLQSLRARKRVEPGPPAKRLLTEEQHAEYGRALGEIAHRILADEARFQANARDSAAVTE